ncbi:MAG TPA: hypothetical protein P5320_08565 [Bacteroidales bacterium]|nr:hypothetical protein [Bacteroidales bacterium]HOU30447.1 hypothetical protein [Bacteroidales bacterium]HQK70902.1 hypothetical protein [Bacteroidales bacterium]HRR16766.1 hypothetical protein [Bacteroidales bacterium]HRT48168.1 hypothetical protein [Bacteroidales bacterium]
MDLTSTIIGVTILILFLLPVYLINRVNKNKRIRLLKKLELQAKSENMNLTETDVWGDSVIGFDSEKGKMIYITEENGEERVFVFGKSDLKSFTTVPNLSRDDKLNEELKKGGRLSLIFSFIQKGRPDLCIDFHIPGFGKISDKDRELFFKWRNLSRNLLPFQNSKQ